MVREQFRASPLFSSVNSPAISLIRMLQAGEISELIFLNFTENNITLRVGVERDTELEPLARGGDPEADEGGVLTGEQGGPGLTAEAERRGSLVQAELVILQSGEHFAVQLPTVKQLRRKYLNYILKYYLE